MIRYGLLASTLLLFGALLTGCGSDCSSASDCKSTEVCFKQLCTPATADYLSCGGDDDCNGPGGTAFECRAGRCRLIGSVGNTPVDSGVPADSGMAMPDSGTSTITDAGN